MIIIILDELNKPTITINHDEADNNLLTKTTITSTETNNYQKRKLEN